MELSASWNDVINSSLANMITLNWRLDLSIRNHFIEIHKLHAEICGIIEITFFVVNGRT